MSREPIPTYAFALVVVRLGHRFLLTQERKHGQLWYLPAGRVEPGESFIAAACRETLEETGISVQPTGILRIEHTPGVDGESRLRMIFLAHPLDDTPPKQTPDEHSLQAAWVSLSDLAHFPLRGEEVRSALSYVAKGGPIFPLSLLGEEGSPWT